MSLGPRMQDEAALAAQVQRAALFSTFAKATGIGETLGSGCHASGERHPAAQIAPRNCRRAIRAAQPCLHTAPIL
jgi:hypothetical protein